jgi:hypothetical protein
MSDGDMHPSKKRHHFEEEEEEEEQEKISDKDSSGVMNFVSKFASDVRIL